MKRIFTVLMTAIMLLLAFSAMWACTSREPENTRAPREPEHAFIGNWLWEHKWYFNYEEIIDNERWEIQTDGTMNVRYYHQGNYHFTVYMRWRYHNGYIYYTQADFHPFEEQFALMRNGNMLTFDSGRYVTRIRGDDPTSIIGEWQNEWGIIEYLSDGTMRSDGSNLPNLTWFWHISENILTTYTMWRVAYEFDNDNLILDGIQFGPMGMPRILTRCDTGFAAD